MNEKNAAAVALKECTEPTLKCFAYAYAIIIPYGNRSSSSDFCQGIILVKIHLFNESGGSSIDNISAILAKMSYIHQINQEIKLHLLGQENFRLTY